VQRKDTEVLKASKILRLAAQKFLFKHRGDERTGYLGQQQRHFTEGSTFQFLSGKQTQHANSPAVANTEV